MVTRVLLVGSLVCAVAEALGYPIRGHSWPKGIEPAAVGAALRLILQGEHETVGLRNRLSVIARSAHEIAEQAESHVAALDNAESLAARHG
jgi:hypothetical protein